MRMRHASKIGPGSILTAFHILHLRMSGNTLYGFNYFDLYRIPHSVRVETYPKSFADHRNHKFGGYGPHNKLTMHTF